MKREEEEKRGRRREEEAMRIRGVSTAAGGRSQCGTSDRGAYVRRGTGYRTSGASDTLVGELWPPDQWFATESLG